MFSKRPALDHEYQGMFDIAHFLEKLSKVAQ